MKTITFKRINEHALQCLLGSLEIDTSTEHLHPVEMMAGALPPACLPSSTVPTASISDYDRVKPPLSPPASSSNPLDLERASRTET